MSSTKRHNSLKLKDKVRLLNLDSQRIYSRKELSVIFKTGISQVYRIINNRENIMRIYHKNRLNDEFTRMDHLRGVRLVLDQTLLEWFKRLRDRRIHVSGPMIKETALLLADILGMNGFKASNGWLQAFTRRYKLSLAASPSRVRSLAPALLATWKSKIVDLINEYDAQDIFTADETGLFFRVLPSQLSEFQSLRCSKGEIPEERATLLLCSNMNGDKEKPLLVSSLFKDVTENEVLSPDVEWKYDKKSFMTVTIMTDWLKRFDHKIGLQGRKILLFLDHAVSHQFIKMDNITLLFVHPNFTPNWDPLEQGVVQAFKIIYRKQVLQHMVEQVMANQWVDREYQEINMPIAMEWIGRAWDEVSPRTIKEAFSRSGFPAEKVPPSTEEGSIVDVPDCVQISQLLGILPSGDLEEYSCIDKHLAIESASDEVADIVKDFLHLASPRTETADEEGGEDEPIKESADKFQGSMDSEKCIREELAEFLIFE